MPRRASLPGAEELFRSTAGAGEHEPEEARPPLAPLPAVEAVESREESAAPSLSGLQLPEPLTAAKPRHDEKITFYCTAPELDRLERVRLRLRTDHRIASDRGRIVRAALAEVLEEFEAQGASSALFRRLSAGG